MMEIIKTLLLSTIVIACLPLACNGFSIIMPKMTFTSTRGPLLRKFSPPPLFLMDGLFDYVRDNFFLNSRQDDFVPLVRDDNADDAFGPGPLLLLYAVPETMLDDDELLDMIDDGMPNRRIVRGGGASSSNVVIRRIIGISEGNKDVYHTIDNEFMDLSVEEALKRAMSSDKQQQSGSSSTLRPDVATTVSKTADNSMERHRIVDVSLSPTLIQQESPTGPTPVLYFSGVTNTEMMDTYKIIANEIYAETNSRHWPACAKAVPAAMKKPLRQVIGEISGDHADAMKINAGQD
jgi:hypothetical protein